MVLLLERINLVKYISYITWCPDYGHGYLLAGTFLQGSFIPLLIGSVPSNTIQGMLVW